MNRSRDGAARFAERRQREDEAPRLRASYPTLATLKLEVEERRGASSMPETKHVRHVIVERAPALFVIMCGDSSCRDGGHDVTHAVLRYLSSGSTDFEVEDQCSGTIGTAHCGRIVRVHALATYTKPAT